jgi:FkbM family methyltransferase
MNYGEGFSIEISGELYVLQYLKQKIDLSSCDRSLIVFDVGANIGQYTNSILDVFQEKACIFAFEPSYETFKVLKKNLSSIKNVNLNHFALSDTNGKNQLFSDWNGSPVASLYKDTLDGYAVPKDKVTSEEVKTQRLDDFCSERGIAHIDLLKLDVEGHELKILQGARQTIEAGLIDYIQFEFGPNNVCSRTYFKDFFDILHPKYQLYRVVKDGLYPIKQSYGYEIFHTINYLAERKQYSN